MKVYFLSNPLLEYIGDGTWTIYRPFEVMVDQDKVIVPAGFQTDLDSVPRIPLAYWLVKGRAIKSAVLHDFLYRQQVGREYADSVMLAAMEEEGVGWIARRLIWAGVRAGGSWAYEAKGETAG
jgi:hypothetical protein